MSVVRSSKAASIAARSSQLTMTDESLTTANSRGQRKGGKGLRTNQPTLPSSQTID